uniref:Retrotransposon Copia-like N-terminal domain-containing protein n=1 Tax=Nymphaea colorata TaxID=210225 RepID=A0A5K0XYG3_9MAGN
MADSNQSSSSNSMKGTDDQGHGTLKITSILINDTYYLSWAKAARLFLSGRSKVGYINGRISPPLKTDPNYEDWESENDMVMAWLMDSVKEGFG